MIDVVKFDFCEMQIHEDYVIVIMKEGITITPSHNDTLLNIVDTYFKNKSFVYISNRLNSYSVNPAVYLETSKIKNLCGFAVVSRDYKAKSNAEIEKLFFNKSYEIFNSIEEAIEWVHVILANNQS